MLVTVTNPEGKEFRINPEKVIHMTADATGYTVAFEGGSILLVDLESGERLRQLLGDETLDGDAGGSSTSRGR